SSSSSSSSGSSRGSTPEPAQKRKREDEQDEQDSDAESSDSESESEAGADTDAAPTPAAESDDPVLSHAEKRRQKKREKQEKADAKVSKKRKLDNGSSATDKSKRQNSVWVGNMSFKTTPEALKEFFKDAGEVTRVHMPTKPSRTPGMRPENRGFAYVDFATQEAKVNAVLMSENNLLGRKLLIKDGSDFTGRPSAPAAATEDASGTTHSKTAQKILRIQKQPAAPTLFLGNLAFQTTEEDIRQLFNAHRPKKAKGDPEEKPEEWIRKIRMGTFEDTGKCKGFAFIDFTTTEHATSGLTNPKNHSLNGRQLVVEYASADAVRRGAVKTHLKDKEGAVGGGVGPRKRFERDAQPRVPRQKSEWHSHPKAETDAATEDVTMDGNTPSAEPAAGRPQRPQKGPKHRPKPGAALALAKRESAAIMPSQGKKVVF
ncbi:unnamed protein product, partial [Mycena citricolor]